MIQNGLPAFDNPYVFNGDFVDRGQNSVEVLVLLMVALILYPSSLFLNRGNHEDIMVTVRYGFQNEVEKKYGVCIDFYRFKNLNCVFIQKRKGPLLDLFKDLFSWLPLYSYIDAGKSKLIVMHGGISDRIHLKQLNSIQRNRCKIIDLIIRNDYAFSLQIFLLKYDQNRKLVQIN